MYFNVRKPENYGLGMLDEQMVYEIERKSAEVRVVPYLYFPKIELS